MLGFTSTRRPVSGQVAREIREQLIRISSGALSEKDLEIKSKQMLKSKFVIVEK